MVNNPQVLVRLTDAGYTRGMKNLQYIALTAALLLAPAFVLAEEADRVSPTSAVKASTERPKPPVLKILPAPGQILKNIRENASTTRVEIKNVKEDVRAFTGAKKDVIVARVASSTPEERKQIREEGRMLIEQKKAEVRTKVEAAKEKAKEKFGEAVQRSVGNIVDNLTKHVGQLGEIATRIDGRISELQAKGTNMDASIALLTAARADITAAQDKVTAVGAALTAALTSATPKTEMTKVRAAVKAAEDAIRAAKDALKTTLDSLKTASITQ